MGWNMIWSQSITMTPFSFMAPKKRTIFLNIFLPLGGNKVRVRFSNILNSKPLQVGGMAFSYHDEIIPVTFQGEKKFEVPGNSRIYSDEITIPVNAGGNLQVRYYLNSKSLDFNYIEDTAGSFSNKKMIYATELPEYHKSKFDEKKGINQFINGIDAIEVWNSNQAEVIAAFGDSITAMSRYTKPLSKRLYEAYGDKVLLINQGISGNCLNYERTSGLGKMYGKKGVERFPEDVLNINGLKSVLFAIGTNDIPSIAKSDVDGVINDFFNAYIECINLSRQKNIRVVGSTIMPRVKYQEEYIPDKEEHIRQEINLWIRKYKGFDYVIDWDELAKDEKHPECYREGFHQGDYLHPSATGGQEMASYINLHQLIG